MIRKLKNILNKENVGGVPNASDIHSTDMQAHFGTTGTNFKSSGDADPINSSPVNFIKRKIKSSKSWVKIPNKQSAAKLLFNQNDSIYATVTSPELANQEFEQFTREQFNTYTQNGTSFDYGFESRAPSMNLNSPVPSSIMDQNTNARLQKHSTLDTRGGFARSSLRNFSTTNSCFSSNCTSNSIDYNNPHRTANDGENFAYFKIMQRLRKCSQTSPANVPLICHRAFKYNTPKWQYLIQQFHLMQRNDIRLLDLNQGVPVNALFYIPDFDLICVRTADEFEGCIPRDDLKPVLSSGFGFSNHNNVTSRTNTDATSCRADDCKSEDDSIKYHSLSIGTDYENLRIEDGENPYSAIPVDVASQSSSQQPNYDYYVKQQNVGNATRDTRDSGHSSDSENMTQYQNNDYETASDVNCGPTMTNSCLENMQSRSRMPISLGSEHLNLTVMNNAGNVNQMAADKNLEDLRNQATSSFVNRTYKSPAMMSFQMPQLSAKSNVFERSKVRRSLDSNLLLASQKPALFQTVDIDIDETKATSSYTRTLSLFKNKEAERQQQENPANQPYPDLDVNRIEQDSIDDDGNYIVPENVIKKVKKIWTVVAEHKAKASQEISVTPGTLVLVIRQYMSWLYVKMVENDYLNSDPNGSQMYGFIPRSCAVDMEAIVIGKDSSNKAVGSGDFSAKMKNPRRSQITAL